MSARGDVDAAVAAAFREEWGQVVATLIGFTGDWDLAEECAQDAFARALERWPRDGVPRTPGAWLTTVARNAARDRVRRAAVGAEKLREAAVLAEPDDSGRTRGGGSAGGGGGGGGSAGGGGCPSAPRRCSA